MRYLFLHYTELEAVPESVDADGGVSEDQRMLDTWLADVDARGVRQIGERLHGPEDATSVRKNSEKLLISDGPFTETKEWIAGFDLIECADLDEAIAIASTHPTLVHGRIEIRPLWQN